MRLLGRIADRLIFRAHSGEADMLKSVSAFALVLLMGIWPSPMKWKSRVHATVTTGFICRRSGMSSRWCGRPTAPGSSSTARALSDGRRRAGAGPRERGSSCSPGLERALRLRGFHNHRRSTCEIPCGAAVGDDQGIFQTSDFRFPQQMRPRRKIRARQSRRSIT